MLEAAASGLGVAIGPYPIVENDLKSGRLVAPFGFLPSGRSYHVLRAKNAPNAAKADAFVAWLVAEAKTASSERPIGDSPDPAP